MVIVHDCLVLSTIITQLPSPLTNNKQLFKDGDTEQQDNDPRDILTKYDHNIRDDIAIRRQNNI